MRFASIGSGSRGNATLVSHGKTTVMIDCGFSAREVEKRLSRLQFNPQQLNAIMITHEHADHMAGVRVFARKYQIPVYATPGTAACLAEDVMPLVKEFNCHQSFAIDDLQITPFPVPHDAREPSQFVFSDGDYRLGLLTDTGTVTPLIEEHITACDALLLEANHDQQMLDEGVYPDHLKYRVGGRLGHLNNVQSAQLLEKIDTSKLQHIVAMHLSEKNNRPDIAVSAFATALSCAENWIGVAEQDAGFAWREMTKL